MNSTTTQIPIQASDAKQVPSLEKGLSTCDRESIQGYRINDFQNRGWVIFDSDDNIAFSGSLKDCEAWMDQAENLTENTGFLSLIQHMLGLYRDSASSVKSVGLNGSNH